MGVRITGHGRVALYDSVTGLAFGPTFEDDVEADEFLTFVEERDGRDPRVIPGDDITALYDAFRAAQEAAGR